MRGRPPPDDSHPALRALYRVTTSVYFREAALKTFPILRERQDYWLFFCYLLFGSWLDKDTSLLLLCAEIICAIEGRDDENSQSEKFFASFNEEVLRPIGGYFEWSWYSWTEKKCRCLTKLYWGACEDIREGEYRHQFDRSGRVYLVRGNRYNAVAARRIRSERRALANQRATACGDGENIRSYMNSLGQNLFATAVEQNYYRAYKAAVALGKRRARIAQLRILRHIYTQPQPFYAPSRKGNTVRLSTAESIPNLERMVRKALTKGWYEFDLANSQFAICGALWNAPELLDFLKSGENLWWRLARFLGLPDGYYEAVKPHLKRAIYSTCYGMDEVRVRSRLAYGLKIAHVDTELATRFLEEPLIKAILPYRARALTGIDQYGGAFDAYENWLNVTADRAARDVMAAVAQSWEMKVISPAFELAAAYQNEFKITLYQYDGFSVHFRRRKELWINRITGVVNEAAACFGFQTRLEWALN